MTAQVGLSDDLFDSALGLEDEFYQEGYVLGVEDGKRVGLIEGRSVGLKAGFEKFVIMGRLHGRATTWAGRLSEQAEVSRVENRTEAKLAMENIQRTSMSQELPNAVLRLRRSSRLESHIKTLFALTEPGSLSKHNNETDVAAFNDRQRRAEGKFRIIEKISGEDSSSDFVPRHHKHSSKPQSRKESNIEDAGILLARH